MLVSTMTDEQLTAMANTVKENLVRILEKEGLLTKSAQEINECYAVILHRRGFFGRIIDKVLGVQNDLVVTVVKVIQ